MILCRRFDVKYSVWTRTIRLGSYYQFNYIPLANQRKIIAPLLQIHFSRVTFISSFIWERIFFKRDNKT